MCVCVCVPITAVNPSALRLLLPNLCLGVFLPCRHIPPRPWVGGAVTACTCLGMFVCIHVHVFVIALYVFVHLCVFVHVPASDSGDAASSRDADPQITQPVNHPD